MIKILGLFTFACAIFLPAWQSAEAQKVDQPLAKQVSVNGTTIRYREQGKGVPVVFVHGAISDHRYWEPQREAVAKSYRFIALDRRYFGTAPWPDEGAQYSPATHVADLAAFIRELKIAPAFLVGVSGGAVVALEMAVRHPELVRALFLQEPPLSSVLIDPADQKLVRELGERLAETQAAAKTGDVLRAANIFVDTVNGQPGAFDAAPATVKAMQMENVRTERLIAPRHMSTTCAQLGQLKVLVTITKGERTPAVFNVIAQAVHHCIPGSQLLTIANASHSAPRQNPSAFNETLLAFLARSSSAQTQTPKQVSVNGTTLTDVDEGSGPVVVFVHGAYSDHRVWEAQREIVAKGYRYIALDLRYFGTAPWSDDGTHFNLATHAADVAAFIRALNAGPVHLVGRSWGAITSLAVAIQHPELVRSLFLNEPGIASAVTDVEERKLLAEDRRCVEPAAAAAKAGNPTEAVKLFFECTHNQPGAFDSLPPPRRAMLLDNARTVVLQVDPARAPRLTCAQLGEIKAPVEITKGELTRPFYQITVGAVHRCIPGLRLITIKGATHSAPTQNSSAFNNALLAFLDTRRDSEPQQPGQPVAKQVSVNGTTIRYWEQGRGVPVAFVHGAISDHRYWEPQREAIAKHYRFIAVDRRYFGTAPWPDDRSQNSQATHVADLAAFIREIKSGPVFLVGTSGGAALSLLTAVQHPELVRGLFVNEPGLRSIVTDPAEQELVREFDRDARRAAARAAAKAGNMTEAARIFADFVNDHPGTFDAAPSEFRAMQVDNARTLALENTPLVPITCAQLGQLKVPVTITKGQLTKPAFKLLAEAAHRCTPRSQLITIAGARHRAPLQNTSAFNEALLAFLSTGQSGAHRSTEEMQVKRLKVNDVELAYVEEGKGETVVFVHGGMGDWRTWESVRPFISARYHYVSLSRRYHHPNPWTDDGRNYTMEQHVEDVAAFIRALKVGKVHLVGNSYGGRLVGYVALKYPNLLRSVVMGEPSLIAPVSPEGKAAVDAFQKNSAQMLAAAKAGDARKAMSIHYDAIAGEQGAWEKLSPERQRQQLDNAHTVIPTLTGARAIPVTCEELSALSVPALVVGGEKSPANFRYGNEALLMCLPKTTEAVVIPSAHHGWNAANPQASAKAILRFLDEQIRQAQVVEPSAKQLWVNGTIIRYWEQGRGVPVVFVHGAISDHRYWEPQRESVAKSYRFIALDRRYFGTAPWPDSGSRHSQATHVADLAAFIRELRIGPAFLVGTSGGAQVSLVMAVQHPELVRGLFVNEPGMESIITDPGDRKVVSEFRTDKRRAAAQAAARAGNLAEAAKLFADFANGQTGVFDALPAARKAMHTDNARTLTLDAPRSEPISCAQLGQLKIAVTITKGKSTKAPSRIIAEAAHRCIPGSQLITIPAAMHGAPWQNPSAFNEALLAFLARN